VHRALNPPPRTTYLCLGFFVVFPQGAVVAHPHVMVSQHGGFLISRGRRVGGGRGRVVEQDEEEGRQQAGEEAAALHSFRTKEGEGAKGWGVPVLCVVSVVSV